MAKPKEMRTVVMGAHGPVCIEDNPRRFIGADPVEVEWSSYYERRLADGELVESGAAHVTAKELKEQSDGAGLEHAAKKHPKGDK